MMKKMMPLFAGESVSESAPPISKSTEPKIETSLAKIFEEDHLTLAKSTKQYLQKHKAKDVGSFNQKNAYQLDDGKFYYFDNPQKTSGFKEKQSLIEIKTPVK